MVGYGTYQMTRIQQGTFGKDGEYDALTRKDLLVAVLMSKLGCKKLIRTNSFLNGGVSQSTLWHHMNQYCTLPKFKFKLTSCVDEMGLNDIAQNVKDLLTNDSVHCSSQITKFLSASTLMV